MKKNYLILSILAVLFFISPVSGEDPGIIVKKNVYSDDNIYISKSGDYDVNYKGCSFSWQASLLNEGYINLRLRDKESLNCSLSNDARENIHKKIFKEILKDFDKKRLSHLFTGPLEGSKILKSFSFKIALASIKSKDWQDWRRNYPNHKSGKSINKIFVEIGNQTDAYKELNEIFKNFNLKLKISSVEKVFSIPAGKLSFYSQLKKSGVKPDERVLYDAGMIYFKIKFL